MPPSPRSKRPPRARGFSNQLRQRIETEALLAFQYDEEDHADSDGLYPPHCTWTANHLEPPPGTDPYRNADCNVYENIIRIRRDIIMRIDDPYSLEQLKAPRMNISVVRPLVDSLYATNDLSIVYCLLVNRMQFIREQSFITHNQTVNLTRALLCELVAEKLLRRHNERNPGPRGLLKLANILVAGFESFQGAPEEVCAQSLHAMHWAGQRRGKGGKVERKLTALELAIVSASKGFLASSACQKVVEAIYHGMVVYTPSSFVDIIPDHWKKRPISLYDPRKAPLLNQYRLIVPRTRNLIEIGQFAILLGLYIAVMAGRESRMTTDYTLVEAVFDIYAVGWVLDQFASILEHGWAVYTQNLWSFLDVIFTAIFTTYLVLRIHAARAVDANESHLWARTSLDVLSCAGPVLIPRLAFNVMSENLLFLSLRAMISDFWNLTALAVWSFAGFLLSLKWLHAGAHQSVTIGKWMIMIWFGLDGAGINKSPDFHWLFGPVLMVLFAFLGNTLFLTVLVSMLTNTFSGIVANAVQEIHFRRAVLTFEGVKSDAIFAYMPPFNILALIFILPLKWVLSERMFHKVNVVAIRAINLPTLLIIAWYERRTLWVSSRHRPRRGKKIDWKNPNGPRATTAQYWSISRFSVHGDVHAVFDIDPPQSVLDRISEEADMPRVVDVPRSDLDNSLEDSTAWRGNSANGFPDHRAVQVNSRVRKHRRKELHMDASTAAGQKSRKAHAPRKDFQDTSEPEAGPDPARGCERTKQQRSLDSIVELIGDHDARLSEATTRLHKIEQAATRMEEMISLLLNNDYANGENAKALADELA